VPTLKWELKKEKVAYIKIYSFSESLNSDFSKAAHGILKSGAQKIILDLRDNPGGYLNIAENIAGWFLKKEDIILIEDYGENQEKKEHRSERSGEFLDFPVIVLINGGSASASEILAGALHDIRGAKLVGEKSFGKGSVQELEELKDGSSIKITVARWLTPSGKSIMEEGLEPNIKIEMTSEDYNENRDPQLDKAMEIIENL
jgi:carboxyl-terminal processing protease